MNRKADLVAFVTMSRQFCLAYLHSSPNYTVLSKSFRTDFFKNRRHMRRTHILLFIQNKPHWHIHVYKLLRRRTVSEKLPKIPVFGPSFIHQLRLLGSQQHPHSGVCLISFSTWRTENSLAESTGVIKGCNIFWGQKLANTCSFFWAGAILCKMKKSREQNAAGRTR